MHDISVAEIKSRRPPMYKLEECHRTPCNRSKGAETTSALFEILTEASFRWIKLQCAHDTSKSITIKSSDGTESDQR